MDNSQIEKSGVYKVATFFTEEFNWIVREQTILDYGIDMQVEIKENREATGVLIALQIKSGDSYCEENKNKSIFTYRKGKLRHLEYWKNHSLPVLFIWYRPSNKSLYWQSVSSGSSHININDKSWTLQIPSKQILTPDSKEELLNRCFKLKEYQVIDEDNISINRATRYRLKVIVSETSKYLIKRIIQNIHDKYIKLYSKQHNILNSLSIFYYRNVNESMYFCRTQWNNKDYDYKLDFVKKNDDIGDIEIEWDNNSDYFNKYLLDNSELISKYAYIEIFDKSIKLCSKFIEATVDKEIDELEMIISDFSQDIQEEFNLVADDNYQSSRDLEQLKTIRMSAINWLLNILNIFQNESRSKDNKYLSFKGYIDDIQKDVSKYNIYREAIK